MAVNDEDERFAIRSCGLGSHGWDYTRGIELGLEGLLVFPTIVRLCELTSFWRKPESGGL